MFLTSTFCYLSPCFMQNRPGKCSLLASTVIAPGPPWLCHRKALKENCSLLSIAPAAGDVIRASCFSQRALTSVQAQFSSIGAVCRCLKPPQMFSTLCEGRGEETGLVIPCVCTQAPFPGCLCCSLHSLFLSWCGTTDSCCRSTLWSLRYL